MFPSDGILYNLNDGSGISIICCDSKSWFSHLITCANCDGFNGSIPWTNTGFFMDTLFLFIIYFTWFLRDITLTKLVCPNWGYLPLFFWLTYYWFFCWIALISSIDNSNWAALMRKYLDSSSKNLGKCSGLAFSLIFLIFLIMDTNPSGTN